MGRFGGWILALLLALGAVPADAQLSGTYTIGTGGTYATFADAVSAVTSAGVSGPVTFDVLSGTYHEQIQIGSISGAGPVNTVTFRSQSGNAADVTLAFTPTSVNNYVVHLLQTDYVTFQNLTLAASGSTSYGIVVKFDGDANNNRLLNNVISGVPATVGVAALSLVVADGDSLDNTVISGNTFLYGGFALYINGPGLARSTGLQITNNVFTNTGFGPIGARYQDGPRISGNTMNPGPAAVRGMELNDCDGALQIVGNRISLATNAYGIYLNGCDGGTGSPTPRGLVANNFVSIGGNFIAYGLYAYTCTNIDFCHNSVSITSSNTALGQALRIENSGGTGINIVNNVLDNEGGGYAYVNAGPAGIVNVSNTNDLYTSGNFLASWGGADRATLAAFQAASGKDAGSVNVYPLFASATDLHTLSPWLDGRGTPVAAVSDDIDGAVRDGSAPDIGADEFAPDPSTTTPLAGTYTIGAGGSYATFAAAQADLVVRGVSAPVTFDVLAGVYTGQLKLPQVPGSGAANTVTFRSQSGSAADATLTYAAAGAADNYVVRLEGADYVRFQDLTLTAVGPAYARVLSIFGGAEDLRVLNCAVTGTSTSGNSVNQALVYADNGLHASRLFNGCAFTGGSYGLYLGGPSQTVRATGLAIKHNTFANTGYDAVWTRYQNGARANDNTVTPAASAARGIEFDNSGGAIEILRNRVALASGGYGIQLYTCDGGTGTPSPRGLVANNFVTIGGTALAYGLYVYAGTNLDLYHNSVNITGTSTSNGQALRIENGGSGLNVVNNILANQGGGYSYVNSGAPSAVNASNTNDLYATGNFVGSWGGADRATLAAFQAASGKDVNSVNVYPRFASPNDLHTPSPWLNGRGTPLPSVSDDIDGGARDAAAPDLGAAEFVPDPSSTTPLAGTYTLGPGGSYPDMASARADLLLKGVSAAVTFDLVNGTYNEQLNLQQVPGADADKTVTFESQSGVANDVTLRYVASGSSDNFVVRLDGADYVRFRNLTLASNTAAGAPFARVFDLAGGCEDIRIEGNVVTGTQATGGSTNQALVYSGASLCTSRRIDGNMMTGGTIGVAVDGISAAVQSNGLAVTGNTFSGTGYAPVICRYQNGLDVSRNTMTPAASAGRGIELNTCDGGVRIEKNAVALAAGAYGIYLYSCHGGTGLAAPRGLIANNFVSIGGNTLAYGLYVNACTNLGYYHNSVNITSTNAASGQALRIENAGGSGINVVNNVLANAGGGYSYYNLGSALIVNLSDHNDLYATGANLGYWGGANRTDLAAFRAASGKDASSVSIVPGFASATDLHRLDGGLDSLATPLADVVVDIDGDPRDPSRPDIGADERVTVTVIPTVSVNDVSAPEGNSGTTSFDFTVSLSAATDQTVTVAYAVSGESAVAPDDFTGAAGVLTFLPGELTKPVSVTVIGDAVNEPTETFEVNLSSASNATLADSLGIGTIINDDAVPAVSVADIGVTEGNAGTTDAVFTLTLSPASGQTVTVNFSTGDGTATAGADYAATGGTATFTAGATAVRETVRVTSDLLNESDETFFLNLTSPGNATFADSQAVCTIVNDDVPRADLALVLADSSDSVAAGTTVHYRIDVTNLGPDTASGVTVRDTLPAGAILLGASGTGWICADSGGIVKCIRAALAQGAASPIFVDVMAPTLPGTIRSAAVVSSSTADDAQANNTDDETTTVLFAGIDLAISKSATPDPVTAGAAITYAIVVTNLGPSAASSVRVRDALPSGMTCLTASGEGWICTTSGGVTVCTRPALAPGSAPPITVSCTAPVATSSISNTATVSAAEADPYLQNNTATAVSAVAAVATSGEAIQNLIAQVQCLVVSGTLPLGSSNALIVKLEAALRAADQGKKLNQLQAFVNSVEALVLSGRLSSDDAQALIAAANAVRVMFPAHAFRSADPYADVTMLGDLEPGTTTLGQNYPNPFNPTTSIRFTTADAGIVSLRIYNTLGQEMARLVDGPMPAGTFEVTWTTTGLESGVYIYRLQTVDFVQSKKLILLK